MKYLSNEKGKLQYTMKIAIHYESNIYDYEYFSDYNDCYIEIIICIPCIPCTDFPTIFFALVPFCHEYMLINEFQTIPQFNKTRHVGESS